MYGIPATRTAAAPSPLPPFEIENRGRRVGNKILKCLGQSRDYLMCAHVISESRRALASLRATSCARDWSWGARLHFSAISCYPDSRHRHASFSLSSTINICGGRKWGNGWRKKPLLYGAIIRLHRYYCCFMERYSIYNGTASTL